MLLVFDIGNTNIKYALFQKETLLTKGVIAKQDWHSLPDFHSQYPQDMQWHVAVCSVLDLTQNDFIKKITTQFEQKPFLLSARRPLPFLNNIKSPETVGVDRLANVAGVYQRPGHWVVIDVGTFLTVDFYHEKKGFLGGVIFPGITTLQKIYHEKSSMLPTFVLEPTQACYGDDTTTAMQVGLFQSYKFLLRGFLEDCAKESFGKFNAIATGGDWAFLQKEFPNVEFDPDLTLKGIRDIYKFQAKLTL